MLLFYSRFTRRPRPHGGRKHTLNRPSITQTLMNGSKLDAKLNRPSLYILRLAVECKQAVRSTVVRLLFWRRPSAIIFAIWAIGVLPLYAQARHVTGLHVSGEFGKARPLITNRDSTAPVKVKVGSLCITATRPHAFPCSVQRVRFVAVLRPIREHFKSQAPATFSATRCQGTCKNGFNLAAVTQAVPQASSFNLCGGHPNNRKTAKAHPFNITAGSRHVSAYRESAFMQYGKPPALYNARCHFFG